MTGDISRRLKVTGAPSVRLLTGLMLKSDGLFTFHPANQTTLKSLNKIFNKSGHARGIKYYLVASIVCMPAL